jgi:AcrR family transcriptional regulator
MSEHSLSRLRLVQTISTPGGPGDTPGRRRRVPAMAPQDRRAALIEATIPLLREHGVLVTTKQIAEAAGVAEGTIFGVFPDKPTLIREALLAAFDPAIAVRGIEAVDPQASLRTRLTDVTRILQRRFAENGQLLHLFRGTAKDHGDPSDIRSRFADAQDRTVEAIARVIEPDRNQLRLSPERAAAYLVGLIFGVSRRAIHLATDEPPMSPELIVTLLLDGLVLPVERETTPFESIMNNALTEHLHEQAFGIAYRPNPGEPD